MNAILSVNQVARCCRTWIARLHFIDNDIEIMTASRWERARHLLPNVGRSRVNRHDSDFARAGTGKPVKFGTCRRLSSALVLAEVRE